MNNPLTIVRSIGDKLIRDTAFEYKLEVAPVNTSFTNETIDGLQFVDFGRTFGLGRPALAYAWTQLIAPCDMEMTIQIEHNDGCKIWLNGEQIYLSFVASLFCCQDILATCLKPKYGSILQKPCCLALH